MSGKAKHIDWPKIRSRLAQNQASPNHTADKGRVEQVFERRATQLAKRRDEARATSGTILVQTFLLGEQRFGIELSQLIAIAALNGCTPVPGTPPEFVGLANWRGEVRSVIELSRVLGLSDARPMTGYVLYVGRCGMEIGLRVDQLEQIVSLSKTDLMVASNAGVRSIKAFAHDNIDLLDVQAILSQGILTTGKPQMEMN